LRDYDAPTAQLVTTAPNKDAVGELGVLRHVMVWAESVTEKKNAMKKKKSV
jgi:hypothetical protein